MTVSGGRRGRLWKVLVALGLVAFAMSDLAVRGVSDFWVEHALVAGLVSSGLFLLLTLLIVDDVIQAREARRAQRVAEQLGHMLVRQVGRALKDARSDIDLMRKAEKERVSKAAEAERAAKKGPGALHKQARARIRGLNPLNALDEILSGIGMIDPFTRLAWQIIPALADAQRALEIRRELEEVVTRRAAQLEGALTTSLSFLAPREDGRKCLEAGFHVADLLHEAARKGGLDDAEAWLAGKAMRSAVANFESAATNLARTR